MTRCTIDVVSCSVTKFLIVCLSMTGHFFDTNILPCSDMYCKLFWATLILRLGEEVIFFDRLNKTERSY